MNGKLLVILGATAIGKTRLAIQLAQALDGEIVSADSRQIYRQMPIGTASPTPEESAHAPHHLIEIVEPDERLALAHYHERAVATIEDIQRRNKLPMLVGGTGQYITAVTQGWTIPRVPPNESLRTELEQFAADHGSTALHDRLVQLDPEYAQRVHANNVRRVIRALEVCLMTNDTMTNQQQHVTPPWDIRTIGLASDRETLYARADARILTMLERGFLEEVRALLDKGYSRKLPAMSGIGYLELCAFLLGEITRDVALERTRYATHDFIRRQEIWFKGHDFGILWHNVNQLDRAQLTQSLQTWLEE